MPSCAFAVTPEVITAEQKTAFEQGRTVFSVGTLKRHRKYAARCAR